MSMYRNCFGYFICFDSIQIPYTLHSNNSWPYGKQYQLRANIYLYAWEMQFILALNKCGKGLETHVCIMQWHKPLVWPSLRRMWSVAREDFLIYFHDYYYTIPWHVFCFISTDKRIIIRVFVRYRFNSRKSFSQTYFVSQGSNFVV